MVVQQHELLKRGPAALSRRSLAAMLSACVLGTSCVAKDLEDVESVEISTHVDDWRDEVIYQLLTDRFANGDPRNDYRVDESSLARYQGGDWQGIIDKLDYLDELGVTTLWISPIVLNVDADAGFDAYHGYWAVSHERLNPHFGDLGTLRKLVNEAHARDMKIILDLVTNHMGQVFYYDINNNGQPDEWLAGGGETTFNPTSGSNVTNGMGGGSSTAQNSGVTRITEYDPEYDPRGVQGFTSLGLSGPAPIRFFDMPEIWRVLPEPEIFQRVDAYNRRGRVTNWDCAFSRPAGVSIDICEQVVLGDFPGGLKDLNTRNPEVREALIASYVRWVLETDLDGFRIDTLKHVEHDFWRVWGREVRTRLAKAGKTNFFMFGEAFVGASEYDDTLAASYTQKDMVDSVFYFPQRFEVFDGVFRRGGATSRIQTLLERRDRIYGKEAQPGGIGVAPRRALVNFIDNHDVPRFLFDKGEPGSEPLCVEQDNCVEALSAALTYLLTEDGIPCIYYGTEQELTGGNDPGNREALWRRGYDTNRATYRAIQKLTDVRAAHSALRRGDFSIRWVTDHVGTEQDAGILAFDREEGDSYALVVINTHPKKTSETSASADGGEDMVIRAPAGTKLEDALGRAEPITVGAGGKVKVRLPAYGAAVFVAK